MSLADIYQKGLKTGKVTLFKLWDHPVRWALRLIALMIAIQVVLSFLGDFFGVVSFAYFSGWEERFGALLVAWILINSDIGRLAIGVFLLFVFVINVTLLILPVDQIMAILFKVQELEPGKEVQFALETLQYFLGFGGPFIFIMLMGTLGSSIVITRQFIKNYEGKHFSWYIYRLMQGTVMALLVIYGLAAGILSVGTEVLIDLEHFDKIKYSIGFISAMAGLFSDQAFLKFREISENIFGRSEDQVEEDNKDEKTVTGS